VATGSGAFSAKCGFNQSGGAQYIVITSAAAGQLFEFPVTSGSGGAFTTAAPVAIANSGDGATLITAIAAGAVVRDMGRTVVVPSGNGARTFRKFQLVGNAAGDAANFGVAARVAGRAFFLETMREGQEPAAGVTSLRIARYM
jgi:hypothetical protein